MAKTFDITARLLLTGPANLTETVKRVRDRFNNINVKLKLQLPTNLDTIARTIKQRLNFAIRLRNIRLPQNLDRVAQQIRNRFNAVNVNIRINVNANRVNSLSGAFDRLNRSLAGVPVNADRANAALARLATTVNSIGNSSVNLRGIQQASRGMDSVRNSTLHATDEFIRFGQQAGLSIRRFAAFTVATGTIFGLVFAIQDAVRAGVAFDRQLGTLQQVTGKSKAGLKDLTDEISRLSVAFGVSSKDITQTAVTLAQAGLSASDTQKALSALAKSALAPSFESMEETTEGLIAVLQQFDIKAEKSSEVLGSINRVAADFAVESRDIVAAVQIAGGAFAAASKGVKTGQEAFEQFISVFTAVRQTTRESAETIATGLRTIFTRVQRESTIKSLKQMNVHLEDSKGKFVGAYEAAIQLSQGLSRLDSRDPQFIKILEEVAGYRQLNKAIPIIYKMAVAEKALSVAKRGRQSLDKDASIAQQTYEVRLKKVGETLNALFRKITQSGSFDNVIAGITKLTTGLLGLADAFVPVLPYLGILAGAKLASPVLRAVSGFFGPGSFRQVQDSPGRAKGRIGRKGSTDRINGGTGNAAESAVLSSNTLATNSNTTSLDALTRAINSLLSRRTSGGGGGGGGGQSGRSGRSGGGGRGGSGGSGGSGGNTSNLPPRDSQSLPALTPIVTPLQSQNFYNAGAGRASKYVNNQSAYHPFGLPPYVPPPSFIGPFSPDGRSSKYRNRTGFPAYVPKPDFLGPSSTRRRGLRSPSRYFRLKRGLSRSIKSNPLGYAAGASILGSSLIPEYDDGNSPIAATITEGLRQGGAGAGIGALIGANLGAPLAPFTGGLSSLATAGIGAGIGFATAGAHGVYQGYKGNAQTNLRKRLVLGEGSFDSQLRQALEEGTGFEGAGPEAKRRLKTLQEFNRSSSGTVEEKAALLQGQVGQSGGAALDIAERLGYEGKGLSDIPDDVLKIIALGSERGSEVAQRANEINQSTGKPIGQEPVDAELLKIGKDLAKTRFEGGEQQKKLNEAILNSIKHIDRITKAFDKLGSVLDRMSNNLGNISARQDSAQGFLSGNFSIGKAGTGLTNALDNPDAYSQKDFNNILSTIQKAVPTKATADAINIIRTTREIDNAIGPILNAAVAKSQAINESDPNKDAKEANKTLSSEIENALRDLQEAKSLDKATVQLVASTITKEFQGKENKIGNSEEIRKFVDTDEITNKIRIPALNSLKSASKFLEGATQTYVDALNASTQAQIAARDSFIQASVVSAENALTISQLKGRNPSLEELQEPFNAQIRGLGAGDTPDAIGRNIDRITDERARVTKEIQQREIKGETVTNDDAFLALEKELAGLNKEADSAAKALKLFAESNVKAAAIQTKINEIEQRGQAAGNILEKLATSSGPQLLELQGQLGAAANFLSTGDLGRRPQDRAAAVAGVKEVLPLLPPDVQVKLQQKLLEGIAKFVGPGAGGLDLKAMAQEAIGAGGPGKQDLTAQLELAQKQQVDALNKQGEIAEKIANAMTQDLPRELKNLSNALIALALGGIHINGLALPIGRAQGGDVGKPRGTDTVHAMLTPGEYVVNAKQTKKHRGLLEKINEGQYFAKGGVVYLASGGNVRDLKHRPEDDTKPGDIQRGPDVGGGEIELLRQSGTPITSGGEARRKRRGYGDGESFEDRKRRLREKDAEDNPGRATYTDRTNEDRKRTQNAINSAAAAGARARAKAAAATVTNARKKKLTESQIRARNAARADSKAYNEARRDTPEGQAAKAAIDAAVSRQGNDADGYVRRKAANDKRVAGAKSRVKAKYEEDFAMYGDAPEYFKPSEIAADRALKNDRAGMADLARRKAFADAQKSKRKSTTKEEKIAASEARIKAAQGRLADKAAGTRRSIEARVKGVSVADTAPSPSTRKPGGASKPLDVYSQIKRRPLTGVSVSAKPNGYDFSSRLGGDAPSSAANTITNIESRLPGYDKAVRAGYEEEHRNAINSEITRKKREQLIADAGAGSAARARARNAKHEFNVSVINTAGNRKRSGDDIIGFRPSDSYTNEAYGRTLARSSAASRAKIDKGLADSKSRTRRAIDNAGSTALADAEAAEKLPFGTRFRRGAKAIARDTASAGARLGGDISYHFKSGAGNAFYAGATIGAVRRGRKPGSGLGNDFEQSSKEFVENDVRRQLKNRGKGFASGGLVDNVPAYLSKGEYVVSKKAMYANGGLVNAINNGVSHFAQGGPVGGSQGQSTGPGGPGSGFSITLDKNSQSALTNFTTEFKSSVDALASALSEFVKMDKKIEFTGSVNDIKVNLVGDTAFAKFVSEAIVTQVEQVIQARLKERFNSITGEPKTA